MKATLAFLLAVAVANTACAKQIPATADAVPAPVAIGAKPPAPVSTTPEWTSTPVAPIRPAERLGWSETYALENGQASAVIVPAIGRLVAFSSADVPSLFRIDEWCRGKLPSNPGDFFNAGGDWIWPVAQSRWPSFSGSGNDWPPPAVMADGPWDCSAWEDAEGAKCAMLTRKYGAPLHIIVSRLFRLEPDSAELVVRQRIERTEPSDIPVVLWNVSQIAKPDAVALFCRETGVDSLAIAIGNAHGDYLQTPNLDLKRLDEIDAATDTPLVLHGGSGIPDDQLLEDIHRQLLRLVIDKPSQLLPVRVRNHILVFTSAAQK